ncbi:MAG: molybdopterin-dependent oxidoreductase [Theionarchaea archaeon]|nr:molybdopterin-dependent oxidoreductase [Theionarchaea archaeon]
MKKLILLLIALVLASACIGQEQNQDEEETQYDVQISGLASGSIAFADLKVNSVEFTAILVKSTGTEIENTWKGRKLMELLAQYDANPQYITFVAQDGYMITLKMEDIQNAYLCYAMDGKELTLEDGGPVRLVIPDQPGKLWMSYLSAIKLIGTENALIIHGKTKVTLALTAEDFARFEKKTIEAEFKDEMKTFEGVPLRTLLNQARYEDDAATIVFKARDGYSVELDFAEVYANEDILVTEDFSLIMPGYSSKYWVKDLGEIEVL